MIAASQSEAAYQLRPYSSGETMCRAWSSIALFVVAPYNFKGATANSAMLSACGLQLFRVDQHGTYDAKSIVICHTKIVTRAISNSDAGSHDIALCVGAHRGAP